AGGETASAVLNLWMQFMLSHLDRTAPMAVFVPVGAQRGGADLVVGEIDGSQFYCLRASPKAMPLVTGVPYPLDGLFIREGCDRLEAARAGGNAAVHEPVLEPAPPGLFGRLKALLSGKHTGALAFMAAVGMTGLGGLITYGLSGSTRADGHLRADPGA